MSKSETASPRAGINDLQSKLAKIHELVCFQKESPGNLNRRIRIGLEAKRCRMLLSELLDVLNDTTAIGKIETAMVECIDVSKSYESSNSIEFNQKFESAIRNIELGIGRLDRLASNLTDFEPVTVGLPTKTLRQWRKIIAKAVDRRASNAKPEPPNGKGKAGRKRFLSTFESECIDRLLNNPNATFDSIDREFMSSNCKAHRGKSNKWKRDDAERVWKAYCQAVKRDCEKQQIEYVCPTRAHKNRGTNSVE